MSSQLLRLLVTGRLLSGLLPCSCALCAARSDAVVCDGCRAAYIDPPTPRCPRCANPGDPRLACGACQVLQPAFDATVTATDYTAPLDALVLQLKFGGTLALAPWCAQVLHDAVRRSAIALPGLLCPVPLGRQRLAGRGYNQALEIARPLARALGIPLHAQLAVRVRETVAQSGVSPSARRDNIRNAFVVHPDALHLIRGQHIGLVDDVMTSGHTVNELAGLFKRFGAVRVSNFVFARTPPH